MKAVDTEILIVGAGLSGLMAGLTLQRTGHQVILVDKGRQVGGRLATRRIGPGKADHGAQFFTVRSPEFKAWTQQWFEEGLIYQWSTGWSDGSIGNAGKSDGYPRYVVNGGMNMLAKQLARELDTRLNVQIRAVKSTVDGWQVEDEPGNIFQSKALILTPPVPQSLTLLETGQTQLTEADHQTLAHIAYAPCLAGLFWLEGTVHLPEPGAIQRTGADISWIADNRQKGISSQATIITVHASPTHSQQRWNISDGEILRELEAALQPFLGTEAKIIEAQLKRWRYSLPTTTHPEPFLLASDLPLLLFAGDGFGAPRIEGAALSGLAAAAKTEEKLRLNNA